MRITTKKQARELKNGDCLATGDNLLKILSEYDDSKGAYEAIELYFDEDEAGNPTDELIEHGNPYYVTLTDLIGAEIF